MTVVGRRIDTIPGEESQYLLQMAPGDYGKGLDGRWYSRPPWKHAAGCLAKHNVIEHDDGTITVSPSILITCWPDGEPVSWHGYLENGVWREC